MKKMTWLAGISSRKRFREWLEEELFLNGGTFRERKELLKSVFFIVCPQETADKITRIWAPKND